jgi:hypothetical protein
MQKYRATIEFEVPTEVRISSVRTRLYEIIRTELEGWNSLRMLKGHVVRVKTPKRREQVDAISSTTQRGA